MTTHHAIHGEPLDFSGMTVEALAAFRTALEGRRQEWLARARLANEAGNKTEHDRFVRFAEGYAWDLECLEAEVSQRRKVPA